MPRLGYHQRKALSLRSHIPIRCFINDNPSGGYRQRGRKRLIA
ncbi:hypothetical protein CSC12_2962 [Klebsiella michiganensis]|nr:hypothetical protein CSC12_2962 [Klebsiella michiganensis]